jgi:hypothetical protein
MNGPASRRQVGRVHASLSALHVTDRDEKLRILSAVVYRPLTTSNDLTLNEAHVCIDVLDAVARREDAAEHLAQMVRDGERYLASVTT